MQAEKLRNPKPIATFRGRTARVVRVAWSIRSRTRIVMLVLPDHRSGCAENSSGGRPSTSRTTAPTRSWPARLAADAAVSGSIAVTTPAEFIDRPNESPGVFLRSTISWAPWPGYMCSSSYPGGSGGAGVDENVPRAGRVLEIKNNHVVKNVDDITICITEKDVGGVGRGSTMTFGSRRIKRGRQRASSGREADQSRRRAQQRGRIRMVGRGATCSQQPASVCLLDRLRSREEGEEEEVHKRAMLTGRWPCTSYLHAAAGMWSCSSFLLSFFLESRLACC